MDSTKSYLISVVLFLVGLNSQVLGFPFEEYYNKHLNDGEVSHSDDQPKSKKWSLMVESCRVNLESDGKMREYTGVSVNSEICVHADSEGKHIVFRKNNEHPNGCIAELMEWQVLEANSVPMMPPISQGSSSSSYIKTIKNCSISFGQQNSPNTKPPFMSGEDGEIVPWHQLETALNYVPVKTDDDVSNTMQTTSSNATPLLEASKTTVGLNLTEKNGVTQEPGLVTDKTSGQHKESNSGGQDHSGDDKKTGSTFEWALQNNAMELCVVRIKDINNNNFVLIYGIIVDDYCVIGKDLRKNVKTARAIRSHPTENKVCVVSELAGSAGGDVSNCKLYRVDRNFSYVKPWENNSGRKSDDGIKQQQHSELEFEKQTNYGADDSDGRKKCSVEIVKEKGESDEQYPGHVSEDGLFCDVTSNEQEEGNNRERNVFQFKQKENAVCMFKKKGSNGKIIEFRASSCIVKM